MKPAMILKGAAALIFIIGMALNSSAQKVNEQELKLNVAAIDGATTKVMSLKPVAFTYDLKKYPQLKFPAGNQYGFSTAETKAAFPELVTETGKMYNVGKNNTSVLKYDEVQQDKIVPLLVAAIKEQQMQIELLKKEIEQLKEAKAE